MALARCTPQSYCTYVASTILVRIAHQPGSHPRIRSQLKICLGTLTDNQQTNLGVRKMYKIICALMHRLSVDVNDDADDNDDNDDARMEDALPPDGGFGGQGGGAGGGLLSMADLGALDLNTLFRSFDMPTENEVSAMDAAGLPCSATASAADVNARGNNVPDDLFGIFGLNWNINT